MQKRGRNGLLRSRRSQAWVETVVYTLIGLTIIGIVVGMATPRIKELTDRAIIEQSMVAMNNINQKMISVRTAEGTTLKIDFRIKKGELEINALENKLSFILRETGLMFSEPGTSISQGDIEILTQENNKKYDIYLILDYSGVLDITYEGANIDKILTQAPTAYPILIKNRGETIDITLV